MQHLIHPSSSLSISFFHLSLGTLSQLMSGPFFWLQEKKGLIKPLPFKPIPRCNISNSSSNNKSNCITGGSNNISKNNSSNSGKFTTTKSNPVNNLNQQQQQPSHHHRHQQNHLHHQPPPPPTLEESSSIMCNRMVVASDLRHKLSDRISCMSPFYSPSNNPNVTAVDDDATDALTTGGGTNSGDSSHQLKLSSSSASSSSKASSSSVKGGTILGSSNFPIKQQQAQQLNQLVDEPIHHSPLTYVMNSNCSSSGIGDSSSSSSQSFTTQSQCSMSQSSYLLDDEGPTWYSPTFDPHQHQHHHHQQQQQHHHHHQHRGHHLHEINQHSNHLHHQQVHEKTHKSNNNNNNNITNNNTSNNGNNPVLPPKKRQVILSNASSSQRHKTVQRSSTFNSDDLTMQSTPSPCSDNDTSHGMTMNELESLVREKDAQISYLRETLEQNEQVCSSFSFSLLCTKSLKFFVPNDFFHSSTGDLQGVRGEGAIMAKRVQEITNSV